MLNTLFDFKYLKQLFKKKNKIKVNHLDRPDANFYTEWDELKHKTDKENDYFIYKNLKMLAFLFSSPLYGDFEDLLFVDNTSDFSIPFPQIKEVNIISNESLMIVNNENKQVFFTDFYIYHVSISILNIKEHKTIFSYEDKKIEKSIENFSEKLKLSKTKQIQ